MLNLGHAPRLASRRHETQRRRSYVSKISPKEPRATIAVWWGNDDDEASIYLTPRNWTRVKAGKPLRIRGKGYIYEAERFQDYWNFAGGMDGELEVTYGNDGAVGFIGRLRDAKIEDDA